MFQAEDLSEAIAGRVECLSKRGKEAFRSLFRRCGGNVHALVYALLSPDFSWRTCHPQIGDKTLVELKEFSSDVLALAEQFRNESGMEKLDWYRKKAVFAKYSLSGSAVEELTQLQFSLGYFPVAAFVKYWIASGKEKDNYIFLHGFSIWKDFHKENLAVIASKLGLTAERCRQIRLELLRLLLSVLNGLALETPCPYDLLGNNLDSSVNEAEGTGFTADFIRFILGNSFPGLSVVGNVEDCFLVKLKAGTCDPFVAAIPASLAESFDFNGFLAGIESRNAEKRTDVSYLPLPDRTPEIGELAATLAALRYGWLSDNGSLVIPPNADKNRSDIMEDIIRDAGRPLSIDEIYMEYRRRYPDRDTNLFRIRGNMFSNPRIIPIGRSGVYSLADWTDGSERGGTIRSFVQECLDNSESHIVPVGEVCDYVRRFRPTSSNDNIVANLMLDSEKKFRIIKENGVSFLSYSSEPIPKGYIQRTKAYFGRRSFEESVRLVEEFITRNGRMPRMCRDSEENRLASFLTLQRSLHRRGLLKPEALAELTHLESLLDNHPIQLELFP